jgi:predicted AAA+ superfamily ATPase
MVLIWGNTGSDLADKKTRRQDINTLLISERDCACKKRIIHSMDEEQMKTHEWFGVKGDIQYIPIWKWLQQPGIP